MSTKVGKKPTKRQRIESAENDLLQKAIDCMDRSAVETETELDGFDFFGRYIASELRSLSNPQSQRWAKLQIQRVLYDAAQTEAGVPPSQSPMGPYQSPFSLLFQPHPFPQAPSSTRNLSISTTPDI